jgi:hypothetical protein
MVAARPHCVIYANLGKILACFVAKKLLNLPACGQLKMLVLPALRAFAIRLVRIIFCQIEFVTLPPTGVALRDNVDKNPLKTGRRPSGRSLGDEHVSGTDQPF